MIHIITLFKCMILCKKLLNDALDIVLRAGISSQQVMHAQNHWLALFLRVAGQ